MEHWHNSIFGLLNLKMKVSVCSWKINPKNSDGRNKHKVSSSEVQKQTSKYSCIHFHGNSLFIIFLLPFNLKGSTLSFTGSFMQPPGILLRVPDQKNYPLSETLLTSRATKGLWCGNTKTFKCIIYRTHKLMFLIINATLR